VRVCVRAGVRVHFSKIKGALLHSISNTSISNTYLFKKIQMYFVAEIDSDCILYFKLCRIACI